MARHEAVREPDLDASLLDRRSYLKLAGTAAATVAASTTASAASATETYGYGEAGFGQHGYGGTTSSQDSGDDSTSDGEDSSVLKLITDSDAPVLEYQFTVEGTVEKRTSGDDPAEGNDSITDNGDGTMTVNGVAGDGNGDSYRVDGTITAMTLDENKFTLYYEGSEVTVSDLTGDSSSSEPSELPNELVIDGTDTPRAASTYTFTVSGEVRKSSELGSINSYDTASDGEISGRVVGGKDGYRFSGEITGFRIDGPATVRVRDGS